MRIALFVMTMKVLCVLVPVTIQTQVCLEGIEIEDLEQTNKFSLRQQQETNQSIYKFTKAQTEIFQRQNELIQKSTNH